MTPSSAPWMSAAEAARLLRVSRTTLYAYVSRGYVRSQAGPGSSRERVYAREDLERLRRRTEERRSPGVAAARALQWGMPVLESAISLIDGRHLYYRGIDAATLAQSCSLEEVAALIWLGRLDAGWVERRGRHGVGPLARHTSFVSRAQSMLVGAAASDPLAMDLRPAGVAATGGRVLRLLTRAATRTDPGSANVHTALARAWQVDRRGADVLRAVLVLCADHELNVSSFTARCVASAGSHPYAVVIAALAALEGPKHGGAGARVEAMLQSMRRTRPLPSAVESRLRRGDRIEGFGHPLYPDGDPRARLLLEWLADRHGGSAEYRFAEAFTRAATAATGQHPNLDFALAAVARVLGLPSGAPLALFALGRSVGWLGHALEQYATNQLIRPRARYIGVTPSPVA